METGPAHVLRRPATRAVECGGDPALRPLAHAHAGGRAAHPIRRPAIRALECGGHIRAVVTHFLVKLLRPRQRAEKVARD